MLKCDQIHHTDSLHFAQREGDLLSSNMPTYSLVGFGCATAPDNAVSVTVGLVTDPPFSESRPIRVLMSREECRDLAVALVRLAQVPEVKPAYRKTCKGHW